MVNYFVGSAEHLSVQEDMQPDTGLWDVLMKHMSAMSTITELAIHLDFDRHSHSMPFVYGDCLSFFIWGFPNLHCLNLLSKDIKGVKLQMMEGFLDQLANPTLRTTSGCTGQMPHSRIQG